MRLKKNPFRKIKFFFQKSLHLKKDLHTYGSVLDIILDLKISSEHKVKKLKHLKKCVLDISEKRVKAITDPVKKREVKKEYLDLINKITLADVMFSK